MEPDDRPNPRDIVIYEALPNELPRVAGIISTVPQTPLSHVNLRAVQDGVPNSFIRDALDNTDIDESRRQLRPLHGDRGRMDPARRHACGSRCPLRLFPARHRTDAAKGPLGYRNHPPERGSASRTGTRSASRRRTWPCWERWVFRRGLSPTGSRSRSISTTSS